MEEMGLLFENAELIAAFPGGASEESNAVSIIGWLTHPIRTLLRTPMHRPVVLVYKVMDDE
ncbi:MAG: hypothetical protein Q8Q18_03465, partial [bacterium]|nr:hypothetical protein [bacterium]